MNILLSKEQTVHEPGYCKPETGIDSQKQDVMLQGGL